MDCDHHAYRVKGPVPPPPPAKLKDNVDTDKDKSKHGNGKIRCPHCQWQPRKSDLWACHCGCQWHTFDTGGRCPQCDWNWSRTECQRCAQWAPHLAWYEDPPAKT
jgi:hypothetical protein